MKTVNEKGLNLLREFLFKNHKNGKSESLNVRAWANELENHLIDGNGPYIELKSSESIWGYSQIFELPKNCFFNWTLADDYSQLFDVWTESVDENELVYVKLKHGKYLIYAMGINQNHGDYDLWAQDSGNWPAGLEFNKKDFFNFVAAAIDNGCEKGQK